MTEGGPEPLAVCLMGATATGKTDLALAVAERAPVSIVSVDSALVYRGMDIGTAKPDADTLRRVPHRLVNILDPAQPYSAGQFRRDALAAMADIAGDGRTPLLVGGTMLYFRALLHGLSPLPGADAAVRARLDARAESDGWPALHAELARVDPDAARRIHPNDAQRIQRALEVHEVSGRTMTDWQRAPDPHPLPWRTLRYALTVPDRRALVQRIEKRFDSMLCEGFVDEVAALYRRGDLTPETPAMRAVGYRQLWEHVAGRTSLAEARERAIVATRQLAKRQMTWLRSETGLIWVSLSGADQVDEVADRLAANIRKLADSLC